MPMQDTSAQPGAEAAAPRGDGQDAPDMAAHTMDTHEIDAGELKETIKRSAREVSAELQRDGRRLVDDAAHTVASLAEEKKSVAADYLGAVAEAAEASRQVLEQRGYAGTSRFLSTATDRLHGFTDEIASRDPKELLDEAVRYARRNPALFIGAALFAGFGLTRLVQASRAADETDLDMDEDDESGWDGQAGDSMDDDEDMGSDAMNSGATESAHAP